MYKDDRKLLYARALAKWGIESQMNMCIEECSELIKAICKFKRNVSVETVHNMCDEIADVEIMCEQMRELLNKHNTVDKIKEEKLIRLQERLNT